MNQSSFFMSVLMLLFHLAVVAGEQRLICPNQKIVEEGADANICCKLVPPGGFKTVDVTKDSDLILLYRHGKPQHVPLGHQYTNWRLDNETLKIGTVTLSISSVRVSDGGEIKINIPSLNVLNLTDLIVNKVQEQNGGTNDSNTTAPPESDGVNLNQHGGTNVSNTTSNGHDGENRKHVIPIVIASISVIGVLVFLIWLNIGKIQERINMLRGRMKQGAETVNVPEEIPLNVPPPGGDMELGRPAADHVV